MRYSRADSCFVKFFLFSLNFLYFIFGGFVLGASIYAWVSTTNANLATVPSNVVISGMVIGGVILITSIIGFSSMGSRGCMIFYLILLLLLVAAQVAIGVLAYQKSLNPETTLQQVWTSLPDNSKVLIQQQGKCCGFANSNDMQVVTDQCPAKGVPTTPGCYTQMNELYQQYSKIAYIILFCLLGLELINILSAFLVIFGCCGIYKREDETLYQANNLNRASNTPVYA